MYIKSKEIRGKRSFGSSGLNDRESREEGEKESGSAKASECQTEELDSDIDLTNTLDDQSEAHIEASCGDSSCEDGPPSKLTRSGVLY